jgi:two-component sensor histidine kinase
MARIDFARYLDGLCAHLFRALGQNPLRIRLDCRIAATELSIDQAVPCGLIVNELVSNALKHAFPEDRAGCITVELRHDEEARRTLIVADDGVGLPDGLDLKLTSTLGLQLVSILTLQLKGNLTVERNHGTAFLMTFPGN